MACGCSKRKKMVDLTQASTGGGQQFEVTAPDGSTSTHDSHPEAVVAAAEVGGGKIRPAPVG